MKILKKPSFITIGLYDIVAIVYFTISKIKKGVNMDWIWENIEEIVLIIGVILTAFVWIRYCYREYKKRQIKITIELKNIANNTNSKFEDHQKNINEKIDSNFSKLQEEIKQLNNFKSRLKGKWKEKFDEKLTF